MPRQLKSSTPPPARAARDTLRLAEAATLLDLSRSTLRHHVKAGTLKATRAPGKYGEEYRIRPAVLKVFALETFGISLEDSDFEALPMAEGVTAISKPSAIASPLAESERGLYERLIAATEEATRYKAICEQSESTFRDKERAARLAEGAVEQYKVQVAELLQEKTALEARLAELEKHRPRRWWFGGKP